MEQKFAMRRLEPRDEFLSFSRRNDTLDHGEAPKRQAALARRLDLEKSVRFRILAHERILGLLIMTEHHFVSLAPDARVLIAAKGRMGGIEMITIDPYTPSLNFAAKAVGAVQIARPHAGPEAVKRVICDR